MYNILLLGNFGRGWDGSVCDELHISNSLQWLGYRVTNQQRESWRDLPDKKFDFILISQWNGYGDDLVKTLKEKYNAPIIYWAFDYQFMSKEQWHLDLARDADLFLSHELEHRKFYEDMGAKFQWFCQDFSPEFIQPVRYKRETEHDVVFTGSYLPWAEERNKTLKAIDEKFDLHIFGITPDQWKEQGFKNAHGPGMDEELPKIIGKVNIAIDHTLTEGYWSDRIAQYMCAGGFVLARYVSPQEMIFGNYPEYFYSVDDCLKKIDYWLEHSSQRQSRASLGYCFADWNLRVINRCRELLTIYENRFIRS